DARAFAGGLTQLSPPRTSPVRLSSQVSVPRTCTREWSNHDGRAPSWKKARPGGDPTITGHVSSNSGAFHQSVTSTGFFYHPGDVGIRWRACVVDTPTLAA